MRHDYQLAEPSNNCESYTLLVSVDRRQMVLHRDLKPANLLIGGIHASPDNTTYVGARYGLVKVADFGLSRVTTLLKADLTPAAVGAAFCDVPKYSKILPAVARKACQHRTRHMFACLQAVCSPR